MFLRGIAAAGGLAPDAAPASMRTPKAASEWQAWLRQHGLAAYTCYQLKSAGLLTQIERGLQTTLRQAYYAAVADAELHRVELVDVLGALAEAGVTAILFKGAVLAYTAYPDPACRPMGDLDLWVLPEAMARAQTALENVGYRQRQKTTRPVELQARAGGEIQLIGQGQGATTGRGLIELHYGVFAGEWVRQTTALAEDCIACRTVPVTVAGCATWRLGAEDAVLQLAVHLAVNHQMSYPGVRGLLDIVLQARAQPPDWQVVTARARTWRVATATWLVLMLTDEVLGLPGAADAITALRPGLIRRGLLARFSNVRTVLAGRDLTRGALRFAYQLLLVDRPRDAAKLLLRTLWPKRDWLALRYGQAGWRERWRHLAAALRGQP